MLIDNVKVEVQEYESLYELCKVLKIHALCKFNISDTKSVYYCFETTSSMEVLIFSIAENFKENFIKIVDSKMIPTNDSGGHIIALANVKKDTFLISVLNEYYKVKGETKAEFRT